MFRKKSDDELWRLQQELLAAEEEELEDLDDGNLDLDDLEGLENYLEEDEIPEDDDQAYCDPDYEEEYDQEPFYRNHANGYGENVRNYANRYGRGSPKRFDDDDLFDEEEFQDEDVLYRRDYKKARRKKRRQNAALAILAVLEIAAIGAVIYLWAIWIR